MVICAVRLNASPLRASLRLVRICRSWRTLSVCFFRQRARTRTIQEPWFFNSQEPEPWFLISESRTINTAIHHSQVTRDAPRSQGGFSLTIRWCDGDDAGKADESITIGEIRVRARTISTTSTSSTTNGATRALPPPPPLNPLAGAGARATADVAGLPAHSTVAAPPAIALGGIVLVGSEVRRRTIIPKDSIVYHATNLIFPDTAPTDMFVRSVRANMIFIYTLCHQHKTQSIAHI